MGKSLENEIYERYDGSFRKTSVPVYAIKKAFDKFATSKHKLRRAGALTTLLAFTGCTAQECTPEKPAIAILNVSPGDGDAPLNTRSEVGSVNTAISYTLEVDYYRDGKIDETITQDSPIVDLLRTCDVDTDFYAWIKNDRGTLSPKVKKTVLVKQTNPPGNHAPVVSQIQNGNVNEREPYTSNSFTVTDADGDALTCKVTPDWLKISDIDANTKLIYGTAPIVASGTSPSDIVNAEFDVSDGKTTIKQPFTVMVNNLVDVSGEVRSTDDTNANSVGANGRARFYNASDLSQLNVRGQSTNEAPTDSAGRFSVTLDKVVSSDKIFLQAGAVSGANALTTYVRTVDVPAIDEDLSASSDARVKPVTVVNYPNLTTDGFNAVQFMNFMGNINKSRHLYGFDLDNLYKGGIEVMRNNQNGSSKGSFSDPDDIIKSKVINDLVGWLGGEKNNRGELVVRGHVVNVFVDYSGVSNFGKDNWIVYEPYDTLGLDDIYHLTIYGQTEHYPPSSIINNGALIKLLSNSSNNYTPLDFVRLHEEGHASNVARFEADKGYILYPQTAMQPIIPSNAYGSVSAGRADLKAEKIVHKFVEEDLDNVLKLSWGFQN